MKLFFSPTGMHVLEALSLADTLYAFDFDGTLAPIVPQPEQAQASKELWERIEQLRQYAPVAIVSGRSVSDLKKRIPVTGITLIGNHGMEGLPGKLWDADNARQIVMSWSEQWAAGPMHRDPEIILEDKGLSLALHYRHSKQRKLKKDRILAEVARWNPSPRIILGKSVVNLVPSGAPHKGAALLALLEESGCKNAFYIGDDDTDEDVFGLRDPRIISVRVGFRKDSQAQFYLQRQTEMRKLLKKILEELRKTQEATHARTGEVAH